MAIVVLDTNAWLDALVFHDPAVDGLLDVVRAGAMAIATDARAMDELRRVLHYPALRLDDAMAAAAMSQARLVAMPVDASQPPTLPRCDDPDDQMFLEIAACSGAALLLSRDDALLRLSRRMQRDHGVAVVPPARWREALAQMSKR